MFKNGLNHHVGFESFVVSECNKMAYDACMSVASENAGHFVAVHGPNACGKSHLLAVAKERYQHMYPDHSVLMFTCAEFIEDYVRSLEERRQRAFRQQICKNDLLIIDDMEFAVGKSVSLKTFTCWFKYMIEHDKNVLIAFDCDIKCLEKMLWTMSQTSRSSITAEMLEPDVTIRKACLEMICQDISLNISDSVKKLIVNSRSIPFYAIRGCLLRISATQTLLNRTMTHQEILACINDYA